MFVGKPAAIRSKNDKRDGNVKEEGDGYGYEEDSDMPDIGFVLDPNGENSMVSGRTNKYEDV